MKIHIHQHKLHAALEHARRICSGQLPVTSNVRLAASHDTIQLQADNLQESLVEHVDGDIDAPGAIGLPARKLAAVVAALPAGLVTIETDAKHVATITSGSTRIKLHGLDPGEFPTVHRAESPLNGTVTSLPLDTLQAALRLCAPAMSDDESGRWILCSVLLESVGTDALRLTASDGRRLVRQTIAAGNSGDIRIPVNRHAVQWLAGLKRKDVTVDIEIGESLVTFHTVETPELQFTTRKIEGQYPQADKVIPVTYDGQAVINRKAFLAALDRVSLIGTESVRLEVGAGELTLSAQTADVGEASEKLACQHEGPVWRSAFNPEYLRVPFETLSNEEVFVDLGQGGTDATVVRDGGRYECAVMPMRLS